MTHNMEEFLNKNDMLSSVLIVKSTMVVDFKGLEELAFTNSIKILFIRNGTMADATIANENSGNLSDNISTECPIAPLERHVGMPEVGPWDLWTISNNIESSETYEKKEENVDEIQGDVSWFGSGEGENVRIWKVQ